MVHQPPSSQLLSNLRPNRSADWGRLMSCRSVGSSDTSYAGMHRLSTYQARPTRSLAFRELEAYLEDAVDRNRSAHGLGEWLSTNVDNYGLRSTKDFWAFVQDLDDARVARSNLIAFVPFKCAASRASNKKSRSSLWHRLLFSAIETWPAQRTETAFSARDLRTIWTDVIDALDSSEIDDGLSTIELVDRLHAEIIVAVRQRLASVGFTVGVDCEPISTRDQILSFALRTGNPPPAGISFTQVTRKCQYNRTTTGGGFQNGTLCRFENERHQPNRLLSWAA